MSQHRLVGRHTCTQTVMHLGEPDLGPLTWSNITMLTVCQAWGNSSDLLKLLTCTMDHGILDRLQTPLELHTNQLVSILARYQESKRLGNLQPENGLNGDSNKYSPSASS